MAICSTCAKQQDKGKTVSIALEAARSLARDGKSNSAKQEYNFVIHLLQGRGRCSSCIKEITRERDANT